MADMSVNIDHDNELEPDITGTVMVAGQKTRTGYIYSMHILRAIAANPLIQEKIRTHSFLGGTTTIDMPCPQSLPTLHATHIVTYLGVEENELRAAAVLLGTDRGQRMRPVKDKLVFAPVGRGSVDSEYGVVGMDYELERIDCVLIDRPTAQLPMRYVPGQLDGSDAVQRQPWPITYAIGIEYGDEVGYTHGPVPDVREMLETVPNTVLEPGAGQRFVLVRFNSDHTTDLLYTWQGGAWVREVQR